VKWQISAAGGVSPRWRHDGREIFFLAPDGTLMAVPVSRAAGLSFEYGTPMPLFPTRVVGGGSVSNNRPNYDVSRDGRFLVNQSVDEASASPITVILNWSPASGR
jgi:hypothetical protein